MSEHTPGPWKVTDLSSASAAFAIQHVDRDDKGRRRTRWVAEIYETAGFESEAPANALLIAVAPELYEAAHTLHRIISGDDFSHADYHIAAYMLGQVLAKACGEGQG